MSINLYDDAFFKKRSSYSKRAPVMMRGIIEIYHPTSYVDCGAALGDLVNEALTQQIDAYGIEGSEACFPYLQCPREHMLILDLSVPIIIPRKYDVLTCFEVAEHIEEQSVDIFIANICQMSNNLVISICDYGPTTKIHPTVKPHSWWLKKFNVYQFVRCVDKESILKQYWEPIKQRPAVKEEYRNLVILEKCE